MSPIKAIALDFDGVLTDGGLWWGPGDAEWKRLSFADVMGVSLARKAGLAVTIISGEDSPLVDRFAAKMNLADITKGCKDKAVALAAFARRQGLAPAEICFMGDDVNDLAAMDLAGVAAAPSDARPAALRKADLVTTAAGGHGAVRELVDLILAGELPRSRLQTAEEGAKWVNRQTNPPVPPERIISLRGKVGQAFGLPRAFFRNRQRTA